MTTDEMRTIFMEYAARHGGQVDAVGIEQEVRSDKNHPLRACLEMNDKAAAISYRVATISGLIRRCRINIQTETRVIRAPAFVAAPDAPTRTYEAIGQVIRDRSEADKRQIVLHEVLALQRAIGRIRNMAAALEVESELDGVDTAIETLVMRVRPSVEDRAVGNA